MERVLFHFGHRTENGWKNVSIAEINTQKPVVLCFGGNGVVSDTFANGMNKLTENLIGVKPKDKYIDMFSIHYGGNVGAETGNVSDGELYIIKKNLFEPLVFDKNEERLMLDEASRNMRNINIISNCYGAELVARLMKSLSVDMQEKGYEKSEIKEILRQVLHVSYAPFSENEFSTNLEVKSLHDEILYKKYTKSEESVMRKPIKGLESPSILFKNYLKSGKLVKKGNTINLYGTSFIAENSVTDEHNIFLVKRDENWNIKLQSHRADAVSKCMAHTLAVGVINSKQNQKSQKFEPLPSAQDFVTINQMVLDEANNTKEEKFQKSIYNRQKKAFLKRMADKNKQEELGL